MELFQVYALLMFPFLATLPPVSFGPMPPPPLVYTVKAPQKKPFSGKAELSFVNTTGNSETQTIGTATAFKLRPGVWLVESDSQFVRTTTEDGLQAESYGSVLRAARQVYRSVDAYSQARYGRNTFSGLRRQIGLDVGFSTRLLPENLPHRLKAEVALGYLSEDRLKDDDRSLASGTGAMRYAWTFSQRNEFTQDTYFTMDLGHAADFRLQHAASIAAGLNSVLSLKFSHTLTYMNQPSPGFRHTDTIGSASVVARF